MAVYSIDEIINDPNHILKSNQVGLSNGKWVVAKSEPSFFWFRVKCAWKVLTGEYDCIRYSKHLTTKQI